MSVAETTATPLSLAPKVLWDTSMGGLTTTCHVPVTGVGLGLGLAVGDGVGVGSGVAVGVGWGFSRDTKETDQDNDWASRRHQHGSRDNRRLRSDSLQMKSALGPPRFRPPP